MLPKYLIVLIGLILSINAEQYLMNNLSQQKNTPRIKFEPYKAMAGETVRLECPQPNPTWFFRQKKSGESEKNFNIGGPGEDIIVTRHGIINADYKYKIMCHMTLEHKVIIINNVGFDEEGLYTCLYSMPENTYYGDGNNGFGMNFNGNNVNGRQKMIQHRYVFNVTVYTLINGLTLNINQITSKLHASNVFATKTDSFQELPKNKPLDIIDSTVTIKEGEFMDLSCVVDSSKPAAVIEFITSDTNESLDKSSASSVTSKLESLISSDTDVAKNKDRTYKTEFSAKLRANAKDHGKILTCKADNGFSNQKWESKKVLNILFKPICKHPPDHTYYIGINQTLTVECQVANANPSSITYNWDVKGINGEFSSTRSSIISDNSILPNSPGLGDMSSGSFFPGSNMGVGRGLGGMGSMGRGFSGSYNVQTLHYSPRILGGFSSDGLTSSFQFKPQGMDDFGNIVCTATNEIGSTECKYSIKLGGVPNPPTDCTHNMKNTSAIISCQVGFHQGDPDIYCYLLRKTENGVYKEHTRNRESCSFIVNDVDAKKYNEFWIYSSNKHGHNKDVGVHLTIGELPKGNFLSEITWGTPKINLLHKAGGRVVCFGEPSSKSNNLLITAAAIGVVVLFLVLIACCFTLKLRKGSNEDSDSMFESDAYQTKANMNQINAGVKKSNAQTYQQGNKSVKIGKFHQSSQDSSYDINDHIKDSKLLINELKSGFNDPSKQKKYNLFKTSTSNKSDRIESVNEKEFQALYSDKFKNSQSNGILINNTSYDNQQLKLKKSSSVSFTKPLVNDLPKEGSAKESTPLYEHTETDSNNNSTAGLLTTVNQTSSLVTFGNIKNSKNTKFAKPASLSGSTSMTSASGSSTSPTTSSTNNDSEFSSIDSPVNTPIEPGYTSLNKPKLSTFSSNSNSANSSPYIGDYANSFPIPKNISQQMKTEANSSHRSSTAPRPRFVDHKSDTSARPPLPPNSNPFHKQGLPLPYNPNLNKPPHTAYTDILETKFLNKLCEDIEVSLNVDCECADDYSSNDFSGDYSFDNDLLKTPLSVAINKTQYPQRSQGANITKLGSLQNVKKNRNGLVINKSNSKNTSTSSNQNANTNVQNTSHIGVLV